MSATQPLYEYLYHGMSLKTAGLVVGALMIIGHLGLLFGGKKAEEFLRGFPRNYTAGVVLMALAFAWTLLVWTWMDLGEFYAFEGRGQIIIVVGFFAVVYYVREFLAVRALGFLMILAAAPFLHAAFLEEPITRLILVLLCFIWIVKGMFWVGMPYLMRDQIGWALKSSGRFKAMVLAGLAYGIAILVCALAFWA